MTGIFARTIIVLFAVAFVFATPVLGIAVVFLLSAHAFLIVFYPGIAVPGRPVAVPTGGNRILPPSRGPPAA